MDTYYLLIGNCLKSQRISVSQVALPCKGELFKILLRFYVINVDSLQLMLVKTFLRGELSELLLDKSKLLFIHFHSMGNLPFIDL